MKLFSLLSSSLALTAVSAVRVMPFGDSITGSTTQFPGCWRALLWQRLQQEGRTANLDFVGSGRTDASQCYGIQYDGDNEGHAGFRATDIANNNQLVGWLNTNPADIILMHLGTNDIFGNIATTNIIQSFTKLLTQMRAKNPNTKLIISQIIPAAVGTTSAYTSLNSQIPQWAAQYSTAQSPIIVVDNYTGFNAQSDLKDGVHPNRSGDQKIADKIYPALIAALGSGSVTTSAGTGGTTRTSTGIMTTTVRTTTTTTRTVAPSNCAAKWGQCGGQGWTGPTCCQSGSTCKFSNNWYSQCL
ncbi:hypothetical protein HK097_006541 [Rhizophlyctis rosea]|uniref:CBM1 domain-containing protein n=1 Tax=Rhizophlyctis rosea TaxID=64517 RepID=A0AAD5SCL5_9FUNG|nr:hypothetical protein HK097_006541 [Rhizophlyctis rosea]